MAPAAFADQSTDHDSTTSVVTTEVAEPTRNIIKDDATGAFLKRIDVGTDEVTIGSRSQQPIDLSGWSIRDDGDADDHIYRIPTETSIPATGEQLFNLETLADVKLGKADKVRVYNAQGALVLQFAWDGDDKNAVYVANSDADGMQVEGGDTPQPPSGDAMTVDAWPGLADVSALDKENEFGAAGSDGDHVDGNLSGLAYEPGSNGEPGVLWAADNDLNTTLGITGPKGPGSINKFVQKDDGSWQQDPNNGWSFTNQGMVKGGKQLHFKDLTGSVDSEGITLINGDSSQGVFIGAERNNDIKNTPRPSILRYDVTTPSVDLNDDGAQDLHAANEWNLTDALGQFGVQLAKGDDANLGVEGVAFIPDAVLTANHFKSNLDPQNVTEYAPGNVGNDYGGLFFVALEKTGHIYALALQTVNEKDVAHPIADIALPQSATNAGYSGPRDLTWDSEHNQLIAEGDNSLNGTDGATTAKIGTYEFKDGQLQLTKLTATPSEIGAQNTEGYAITPDAEATKVVDGKAYKPVFWSDDGVTGGHSLRMGYIEAPGVTPPVTKTINLLNFNDFHGRIDKNLTVPFAATVEQLKAEYPDSSLLLSAGDSIGASLFNSSVQQDQPTIDVLNAMGVKASAVGNHEFDQGYDDLTKRVIGSETKRNAQWDYLGANVYKKGTDTPALDEYSIQEVNGVKVGVIGAVTQETGTLVSPGGVKNIDFGDPIEAVNRVARQLSDGDQSNGEADVIVAEYHEGASSNEDDATAKPTLDEQKAASPVFKKIVDQTDPAVNVIFTAHTHMKYSYTDPAHANRPIIQTGSYAANVGQVVLDYDKASGKVAYQKSGNVASLAAPEGQDKDQFDTDLAAKYSVVAEVKRIVDAAVAKGEAEGGRKVGTIATDITTAFKDGARDDRASESTMGNYVADALLTSLSSTDRGGAEIGVVNPGGLRAEFCKTGENAKCTLDADGNITYAQANAVLPFLNNLWTTTLTGAQFKDALEQQWQTDADGKVPSRPYLQLGLSNNVSYTYDPNAAQGHHITSVMVSGKPLDLARDYRIGSFSFLLQGGDNFRAFAQGKNTKDTGLVDRDAWIEYIRKNSPIKARYDRRSVAVTGIPAKAVKAGDSMTLKFSKLTLTSLGVPAETKLTATIGNATVGEANVVNGDTASLKVTVPAGTKAGNVNLSIVSATNKTTVTLPIAIAANSGNPVDPNAKPKPGPQKTDLPNTGSSIVFVALAVAVFATGGVALMVKRREADRR
jgi:5'-nucleotidase